MNTKSLLLCAACLIFNGSALAQFRLDTDTGTNMKIPSQNYKSKALATSTFTTNCYLWPVATGVIVDTASGERTAVDCSAVKALKDKRSDENAAKEKARREAPVYTVFSRKASGNWEKGGVFDTAERARNGAGRECVDRLIPGRAPNAAAKIVDPSGGEVIIDCTAKQ